MQSARRFFGFVASAIGVAIFFFAYAYVRLQLSFNVCETGAHPYIGIRGLVAAGFGGTICTRPTAVNGASILKKTEVNIGPTQEATAASVLPVQQQDTSEVATFHGFACEEVTCAGHLRGYDWAEEKAIDDPHSCYRGRLSNENMLSFSEGCEAFVDENTGDVQLEESERYTDDDGAASSDP